MDRDKLLVKQIKEFFSVQGDDGVDQLDGIGFVAPSPQVRLTPTQKYVFHSILSVFGNDVADNIFLMVTFCDGKKPPVLGAVETAGVPFRKDIFKFNNSALFANNITNEEFDQMFWKMGHDSFNAFFDHFRRAETRSLQKSREVLQEREQLEITIQGLQRHISAGLNKIDEMRIKRQILQEHETDIIANREFTREVKITKHRKKIFLLGILSLIASSVTLLAIKIALFQRMRISFAVGLWIKKEQGMLLVEYVLRNAHGSSMLIILTCLNFTKILKQ